MNAVFQLVSVPIFLKYWGTDLYGQWIVLTSISAYFSIADFGLGTACSNEFIFEYVKNHFEKCRQIFVTNLFFTIGVFIAFFTLIYLLNLFLDFKSILNITRFSSKELFFGITATLTHVFLGMISGLYNIIYRARQNYSKAVMLDNYVRFFEFLSILFGVAFELNLITILFILLFPRLVIVFYKRQKTSNVFHVPIAIKYFRLSILKRLLYPSFGFLTFPLGDAIQVQGITFLINSFLGSSYVVIFNTARTLFNFLKSGLVLIKMSVWPELAFSAANNNIENTKKIYYHTLGLSFYVTIFSILFLLIFGEKIYLLWVTNESFYNRGLFNSFLVAIFFNTIWYTGSIMIFVLNKHFKLSLLYFIGSFISLIFAIYLLSNPLNFYLIPYVFIGLDFILIYYVFNQTYKILGDKILVVFLLSMREPFVSLSRHFKIQSKYKIRL